MSRRSRTTLSIQVRIPVPPGSNAAEVIDYVRKSIQSYHGGLDPQEPIASIQVEEMIVKLQKKETVYL